MRLGKENIIKIEKTRALLRVYINLAKILETRGVNTFFTIMKQLCKVTEKFFQTAFSKILLVVLVVSFGANAQISVPDSNFAAAIRSACPDCIDNTNKLLAPAASMKGLDVSGKGIKSLEGIQGFTSLETLLCASNSLTTLPPCQIHWSRFIAILII